LFSQGKNPVEVAIDLNLEASHVEQLYIEYWKLMQQHQIYLVYKEIGSSNIGYFLNLYRIAKKEDITTEQIINLLKIANDIQFLEKRSEWLANEIKDLELRKMEAREELEGFNTKIANAKEDLFDMKSACKQIYAEFERVVNLKRNLEAMVKHFKSTDEDIFEIEYIAEEKVKNVLTDNKKLLEFALIAVVEALRKDPDRYLLIDKMILTTTASRQGSSFSSAQHYGYDDNTDLAREKVLEAADRLFNKLTKGLASYAIYTTANCFSKNLSPPLPSPSLSNSSSSLILPEHQKKALEVGVLPADDDFGEDEDLDIEIEEP
jgi:hypothetical protein